MRNPAAFSRSLLILLALALGPAAGVAAASSPQMPVQPAGTYSCRPAAVDAAEPPSALGEREYVGPRPCPAGQVPVARMTAAELQSVPPGPPGVGTKAPLAINFQYAFDKPSLGFPNELNRGMRANTTVLQPAIGGADYHSLGQIWALDQVGSTFSDVELGWTVDPGLNGDSAPHLFSYTFDEGKESCYNGACGNYVQVSETIFPGMLLAVGTSIKFEVKWQVSGWWLGVNGVWIGYYKFANWPGHAPGELDTLEAGGEIASTSGSPCADMGTGSFPTESSGATFWDVALMRQKGLNAWTYISLSPKLIVTDEFGWRAVPSTKSSSAFNYGGPGYC